MGVKMEKKKRHPFKLIIAFIIVAALAFGAGYYFDDYFNQGPAVADEEKEHDWKLPTETEKTIVTVDEVKSELAKINEISSYSGEYTVKKSVDNARYLIDDFPIPGTKNSITIECKGIVKVGYDITDITIDIDDPNSDNPKIHIALPEPTVHDNYVIWDTVKCTESNTPLHPIEFSQYQELVSDIEEEGLVDVESKGIYDKAEEHIKEIIMIALSGFTDYTIVFM